MSTRREGRQRGEPCWLSGKRCRIGLWKNVSQEVDVRVLCEQRKAKSEEERAD